MAQVIAQDGVLLHREAALSAALAKPEQRNLCAQDVNVETATAVIPKHTALHRGAIPAENTNSDQSPQRFLPLMRYKDVVDSSQFNVNLQAQV